MIDSIQPGSLGAPVPDNVTIVRLGKPMMDTLESHMAHEAHFSLSSEDEATSLQSLSVWVVDLTPPEKAQELMGANRATYRLALHLNTTAVRAIRLADDAPFHPLNVVWDPDPRSGAEGHAGITGLMRPPGGERMKYKALRAKLAQLAVVEILPAINSSVQDV